MQCALAVLYSDLSERLLFATAAKLSEAPVAAGRFMAAMEALWHAPRVSERVSGGRRSRPRSPTTSSRGSPHV